MGSGFEVGCTDHGDEVAFAELRVRCAHSIELLGPDDDEGGLIVDPLPIQHPAPSTQHPAPSINSKQNQPTLPRNHTRCASLHNTLHTTSSVFHLLLGF
eukprot:1240090-Rhodomonas_salina.1